METVYNESCSSTVGTKGDSKMKKFVMMVLAVLLVCSMAIADGFDPILPDKPSPFPYLEDDEGNPVRDANGDLVYCYPSQYVDGMVINTKKSDGIPLYRGEWVADLEAGTHANGGRVMPCDFTAVTVDGKLLNICPICGNVNNEFVMPLVKSSALQIERVDITAPICNFPYVWNTNGQYVVRMMRMPEDSEAAYIFSVCHEMAGTNYPAECAYSMVIPVDGRNCTLKKAYGGGLRDFYGYTNAASNGYQVRATTPSDSFGVFVLVK